MLRFCLLISALVMYSSNGLALNLSEPPSDGENKLVWATEIYPPFSYYSENELTGFSVDLLHLVWKELKQPPEQILVLPWARAYYQLQQQDNMVLFSVSRLPHREALFQWACPIDPARYVLFSLKAKEYPEDLAHRLQEYQIGTVREDAAEQLLIATFGDQLNLVRNVSMRANLEMMQKNRIDFIAYDERSLRGLEQYGFHSENYKKVLKIHNSQTCFAFSSQVDKHLVGRFQQALTQVIQSDEYQALRQRYEIGPLPAED